MKYFKSCYELLDPYYLFSGPIRPEGKLQKKIVNEDKVEDHAMGSKKVVDLPLCFSEIQIYTYSN